MAFFVCSSNAVCSGMKSGGRYQYILKLRSCLYGGGLAGLAFAEISPSQKIPQHYFLCFIFCLYESRASPVRRDPAFAYPRSRLSGLIFLHINSTARAGSRPGIVHNINFKRALVHSLNFEAGRRRKGSRRDKQTIASLQGTLAITKYIIFLCNYPLRYCLNSVKQNC